jgi:hypothetical protein
MVASLDECHVERCTKSVAQLPNHEDAWRSIMLSLWYCKLHNGEFRTRNGTGFRPRGKTGKCFLVQDIGSIPN